MRAIPRQFQDVARWRGPCSLVSSMSKPIPAIRKYMTTTPHSIGGEQTLETASRMMREHHIRHLPVLHGGKLLGVLTDRDLKFIEAFRDVDVRKVLVEEAMSGEPYTVSPDTPLDQVVSTMAAEKYGSAIVMDNQHVVGIFTTVDACRALAELLETRLSK
jgi:acetoin utilization protein AcuB